MGLFNKLKEKAQANIQRIVLPEGTETRTLTAADMILAENIAKVILIGEPSEIAAEAEKLGLVHISEATIINPNNTEVTEKYAQLLCEIRKSKGMSIEEAREVAKKPLYLGCLIVKSGDADGQVAGALNTTGDVLRAAFQVIKTAPGVSNVSGAYVMELPQNSPYGTNDIMVFADCAVVPNPNAEELAEIAILTAKTAKDIANMEPRVAMLSFSTKGSGKHALVDKVVEATKIAKEKAPELLLDGEMQVDAAIVPEIGERKAPESKIAGHANVLVFPSLNVGNIAYKLVERLAGVSAVGPVLQGLAAPVSDLSRGCSSSDIYKTIIITCNQALNNK